MNPQTNECCICYSQSGNPTMPMSLFVELYTLNRPILAQLTHFVQCSQCAQGIYCTTCLMQSLPPNNRCSTCRIQIMPAEEANESDQDYGSEDYDSESDQDYLDDSIDSEQEGQNPEQFVLVTGVQGALPDTEIFQQQWLQDPTQDLECQICFKPAKVIEVCKAPHFMCIDCILAVIEGVERHQQQFQIPENQQQRECSICNRLRLSHQDYFLINGLTFLKATFTPIIDPSTSMQQLNINIKEEFWHEGMPIGQSIQVACLNITLVFDDLPIVDQESNTMILMVEQIQSHIDELSYCISSFVNVGLPEIRKIVDSVTKNICQYKITTMEFTFKNEQHLAALSQYYAFPDAAELLSLQSGTQSSVQQSNQEDQ